MTRITWTTWIESETWYSLASDVRNQYRGKYIAMYNGEIIDTDVAIIDLYKRIRSKYGDEPVLMVEGGDHPMPEYRITSVFLER